MIKEYSSKVDLLMSERKDAKEAVEAQHEALKQQQAHVNSYATLMPLALPAPPMPGQQTGGGYDGYGAQAGFTGQQYGGGY